MVFIFGMFYYILMGLCLFYSDFCHHSCAYKCSCVICLCLLPFNISMPFILSQFILIILFFVYGNIR